ncbi:MAG: hypothetical protein IH607_00485 [Firmicutes bacterium]|nr:hypothetical protein [Bacillota bacterium]
MIEFSLSRRREQIFPNFVEDDDGNRHRIRPGHQTILKIFRLLEDEDIQEHHRIAKACDLFLMAPIDMLAGYALLLRFLNYGEMPNEEEPNRRQKRLISFEQDAPEIYASFLQVYGIDLLETDIHWYRFNVLLVSLLRVDGNPLAAKLRLRTLDTGKLKGRDKHRAEAAKQSVAIRERVSPEAQRLERQLIEAIQNGGNIAEILKQRA